MADPVFEAYMRAAGIDPEDAIANGVETSVLVALRELGMDRFEATDVAGVRKMNMFAAWLTPQIEYLYARQAIGAVASPSPRGVIKVHRSGFPSNVVTAMAGEPVGRFIRHPLLPEDLVILEASDLRPQFDIVNIWLDVADERKTRRHLPSRSPA